MEEVITEWKNGIGIIRIERENKLNPLDTELLQAVLEAVRSKDGVKILVGSQKAFSAGANIKKFVGLDGAAAHDLSRTGHDIMNAIADYPFPVIAAIDGYALGGGFELALACDIRVVAGSSKLGLTESNIGILPGWGGTQRLRELCGEEMAFYLIGTGKVISGEEAHAMGIAAFVAENPLERAIEIATEFSKKSHLSLGLIKKLVRARRTDAFDEEMEAFGKVFDGKDSKEGVKAFLEKREPSFRHP